MRCELSAATRRRLDIQGFERVDEAALAPVAPWLRLAFALCALLAVAGTALASPGILMVLMVIAMLAVPILIQVYFNAGLAYWLNKKLGVAHCVAGPSALIGASNFFELAVATAVSLFGLQSGAALATVVGVLIEVPVMLSVVKVVGATKGWYEGRGPAQATVR